MQRPGQLTPEQITAVVDTREQQPLQLSPLRVVRAGLQVGDYSVRGAESVVAVERKSLPDLVACCGRERKRFQKELNALRGWPVSAVVVEASWQAIDAGGWRGRVTPKQVQSSLLSWIAQGHCLILADDHERAGTIVAGILYYAARHRYQEARALSEEVLAGR